MEAIMEKITEEIIRIVPENFRENSIIIENFTKKELPDAEMNSLMAQVEKMIGQEFYYLYISKKNGIIIGVISFFILFDSTVSIIKGVEEHWLVSKEYRNSRLAFKLFKKYMDTCKEFNVERVYISSYTKKLDKFYEKKGFICKSKLYVKEF